MFLKKNAKHKIKKKRTGIWTFGASGTSSWWVKLWKLSRDWRNFYVFEKSCKKWELKKMYRYLYFWCLRDPLLVGQIMEAVLCFLKFAFFWKKLKKIKTSKNLLVSGLLAPPGPPLGGANYGCALVFFEICIFLKKVTKHANFKIAIVIWTLGASPAVFDPSGTTTFWVQVRR